MKIRFVQPCELEIVANFKETTKTLTTKHEIFKIGDVVNVDIIETNDAFGTATLQFENGSCVYGLPQMMFESVDN